MNKPMYECAKCLFSTPEQVAEIKNWRYKGVDLIPFVDDSYTVFDMKRTAMMLTELKRVLYDQGDMHYYEFHWIAFSLFRYLKKKVLPEGMEEVIFHGVCYTGISIDDIDSYVTAGFSACQLEQILLGMESGVDVTAYADISINPVIMKAIRWELEDRHDTEEV